MTSSAWKHWHMWTLWHAQDGFCAHCWKPLMHPDIAREIDLAAQSEIHDYLPSIDHVIPRALRGPNTLTNMLLTHKRCNERRGTGRLPGKARTMHRRVLAWIAKNKPQKPTRECVK